MSERAALLRHIIEHPDDDAARMVMADWLDENGEPERAEFVRLQVSLAQEDAADDEPFRERTRTRLRREFADPDRQQRFARMSELHNRHRAEWVADLAKWAQPEVDFCRGFVGYLHTTAKRWLSGAKNLLRAAPLTELSLVNTGDALSQVLARPELARIRGLTLEATISTEARSALVRSPHVRRLRAICLAGPGTADHGATRFDMLGADWPALETLLLDWSLSDEHLTRLIDNATFGNLLHLSCNGEQLTASGVPRLANARHLGRLTHLSLPGLTSNLGALALVRSNRLEALRDLRLTQGRIREDTVVAMAELPGLARLRRLDLTDNAVGDVGAIALAASPHVTSLRTLELRGCRIGNEGVLALARSPFLNGLQTLNLEHNSFGRSVQGALRERFGERVRFFRG